MKEYVLLWFLMFSVSGVKSGLESKSPPQYFILMTWICQLARFFIQDQEIDQISEISWLSSWVE